jgi:signal transduction histidine kinase
LLRNGIDAMHVAGVNAGEMIIETRRCDQDKVAVLVKDQGGGIPDELKEEIFKSFYTTKKEGMGMGLAICHSIIESHGGSLEADNRDDGGAVFKFMLPLVGSE